MLEPLSPPVAVESHRPSAEVEAALLRTVLYADVFDYPLTLLELHHYLIGAAVPLGAVWAALESDALRARLVCLNGYYTLRERAALVAVRTARRRHSARLWRQARFWARWLGLVPFVRMVAVTGALAMDNVPAGDDIDLLIVTEPGRVWLARALCVALVYAARLARVRLCPNYVLARTVMPQAPRDLYIAHELAQMVPLVGLADYHAMRAANAWTQRFLPQAGHPLRAEADRLPRGLGRWLQRLGEWALGGRLGEALERWEQSRKQRKFARLAAARGLGAARLDAERVKGHFDDHSQAALTGYRERLRHYGLRDEA